MVKSFTKIQHWFGRIIPFKGRKEGKLASPVIQPDDQIHSLNSALEKDRVNPRHLSIMSGINRDLREVLDQPVAAQLAVNAIQNGYENEFVGIFLLDDEKDEFVIAINFSNRPLTGWVETMHDGDFKPVRILGMPEPPAQGFPLFRLNGFEWRIYHRVVKH